MDMNVNRQQVEIDPQTENRLKMNTKSGNIHKRRN